MRLLVTGAAGFIGSAYVRVVLEDRGDDVVVLAKLTYARRRRLPVEEPRPSASVPRSLTTTLAP